MKTKSLLILTASAILTLVVFTKSKGQISGYRLISTKSENIITGNVSIDSERFVYSGGRGGTYEDAQIKYDSLFFYILNSDSVWITSNWKIQTFNDSNQILTYTQGGFDSLQFIPDLKDSISYDSIGNAVAYLFFTWNGSLFLPISQYINSYEGSQIKTSLFEEYNGINYDTINLTTTFYDSLGLKTEVLIQQWNNSSWSDQARWLICNDVNGKDSFELYQFDYGGGWEDVSQFASEYNSDGLLNQRITNHWTGSQWYQAEIFKLKYKPELIRDTSWNFEYDEYGNNWLTRITSYRYDLIQTVPPLQSTDQTLVTFPNPFSQKTTIEFSLTRQSNVRVEVFNAYNNSVFIRESKQDSGVHQIQFDASNLPAGIYLCALSTDDFKLVKKIIVAK